MFVAGQSESITLQKRQRFESGYPYKESYGQEDPGGPGSSSCANPTSKLYSSYPIWQERRAEAAIGRMCRPKARSGTVEASNEVQKQFKAGGATRMKLIREYMAAADKDCSAQLDALAHKLDSICPV